MNLNFENKDIASGYKWAKQEELLLLKPYIEQIGDLKNKSILDVGCGTGWITKILSKTAKEITGIDISETMINLAKEKNNGDNINYLTADLLKYKGDMQFDIVVSALTLQLIKPEENLLDGLSKISQMLKDKGKVVFLVPHPCFSIHNKRDYNTYIFDKGFNYFNGAQDYKVILSSELAKIEFISNFYSLQNYFDAISEAGFTVKKIIEPRVTDELKTEYPGIWDLETKQPFYIIFELIKIN